MSAGRHVRRARGLRALRRPLVLFACAFALASGTAAFAYTTVSGSGTGQAQAVALQAPGAGTVSAPTATSLSLSWAASPGLPPHGGYLVLRSTAAGGPYEKASNGTCQQDTTLVSAATSCTDTGLAAGTTYYYEVESAYYDIRTLWASAPDTSFSGKTTGTATQPSGPAPPGSAPAPAGTPPSAPAVTSAPSATLLVGLPGTFQVLAKGNPGPTFSNTAFGGCTPSTLPPDVTFSSKGLLSGSPAAGDVGSYTVCVNAANGLAPVATQKLTLTVVDQRLAFSSPAVSGAASSAPNLGPITVRRQTGSGAPITTGGALTVTLTSNPTSGAALGTAQFAAAVTSVTIPSGQSTATLWYGSTTPGSPAVTASAPGFASGTQVETITAAPAGLGVTLGPVASGTPAPVLSCGPAGPSVVCNVAGVAATGSVALTVGFRHADGSPAVYSATQGSLVTESGSSSGSTTIGAGAAASGPGGLTAAVGTSSLTFGPYTLIVDVGS